MDEPVALPAPEPVEGLDAPPPSVMEPARRALLRWAAGVGGVVAGVLTFGPAARAFLSPLVPRRTVKAWARLGEAALFDPGVPVRIDFTETVQDAWTASREIRNVWLVTENGRDFTVYSGVCTHLGCSFRYDAEPDQFHAERNVFHCPCHHAIFDVKTGAVLGGPAPRPLDRLESKVEDGIVYVLPRRFRVGVPEQIEI